MFPLYKYFVHELGDSSGFFRTGHIAIHTIDGLFTDGHNPGSVPSVTHHGRTTAYSHTEREGPSVLCVHGSGGTNTVWKAQRARLPADVVALDLAGHGASDAVDAEAPDPLMDAYIDDVVAVTEHTTPTVLVGHSLGGAVVLRTILDRDVAVDAAIVLGAGGRLPVADQLLDWLATDFSRFIEFMHEPDRLFHQPDDRLRTRSEQLLDAVGQQVTHRDFVVCDGYDVRDRLDHIEIPLLGVVGSHDTLTPPKLIRSLTDAVTTGAISEIPEAAHMTMVEQPQSVNTAIETFLNAEL